MRWVGLVCCVSVAACGPTVAIEDDAEGGTDGASSGASESSGSSATAGDDVTGAPDESGSSSDDGGPVTELCGRAADEALAVVIGESSASVLRGDGSSIALELGTSDAPPGASMAYAVALSGTRVAIAESWTVVPDGASGASLAMFDVDGALQWSHSEADATLGAPLIAADGSVVLARTGEDGSVAGLLVDGDAPALVMPDFWPATVPRSDGLVPGHRTIGDVNTAGWLDPADGSFQPVSLTSTSSWHIVHDGGFVYLTDGAVIIETPDTLDTIALDGLGGTYLASNAGEWLLLRTHDNTGFARVSFDGVVEALDLTPSAGLELLVCYDPHAQIDASGAVLIATRDAVAAQVHRLDPVTGAWAPIGFPVTQVDNMDAQVLGDTYFVRADGFNTTFCPTQEWEPAPDALSGTVQQLVRPSAGASHVLPIEAYVFGTDAAGTCAVYYEARGATILDVESGATLELAPVTTLAFEQTLP